MVDVKCNYCHKNFKLKGKSYIKEHNFCCRECYHKYQSEFLRGENNKNSIPKNIYYCANCGKEILMLESQAKYKNNIFCNKTCRFEYDSKHFKGEGNPNYSNKGKLLKCLNCGKEVMIYGKRKDTFQYCCLECRNEHWSKVKYKTDEMQERFRQQGINAQKRQKTKFTKPELIVYDYLSKNNIDCIPQHPMFNRFVVDFYIPSLKMVIEVLGDYWHGNPLKYSIDKLTEKQLKTKEKDLFKMDYLTKEGYEVRMIWENDIYKQLEKTMEFIIK